MKAESISLFYKEGSSDKVYEANLIQSGTGWTVTFAYGRRGNALAPGTKTTKPIKYEDAKKIYDQLVRSKTSKGYTPSAGGSSFSGTSLEKTDTGVRLQLLNDIDESEVHKCIEDSHFCAQEKYDGRRRALIKAGNEVTGTNRKGLAVEVEDAIKKDALSIKHDFKIDGEQVGDILYVFDLLELDGADYKPKTYDDRYAALGYLLPKNKSHIVKVATAYGAAEKQGLFDRLEEDQAEGIVFKDRYAPYTAGRPNTGGSMLKFKFYSTLSVICSSVNVGRRSIALELLDGKKRVPVGNVTVYPNQEIPAVGDIVEVRYLYAYKGGSLFQPVLLTVREDLDEKDCTVAQLKYKPEDEEV